MANKVAFKALSIRLLVLLLPAICAGKADSHLQGDFQGPCIPIQFRKAPAKVSRNQQALCLTMGQMKKVSRWGEVKKNFLLTTALQTRAVLNRDDLDAIGLCFSYLDSEAALSQAHAEDLIGRQIGLKLKAQDSCNVLYVMWRIRPVSEIVISRKLNLGRHTHKECRSRGYKTLARIPLEEPPAAGEFHSLRVKVRANRLLVYADEQRLWQGYLSDDLSALQGPMGLRTDFGTFLLQMDSWRNIQVNCPLP